VRIKGVSASPTGARRSSDGILIEASILARVLGLRLLTLDATITLVPAEMTTPSSVASGRSGHPTTLRRASPAARSRVAGGSLARAVQTIDEGEHLLGESRRNGAAADWLGPRP
jgi:hypothetical protein